MSEETQRPRREWDDRQVLELLAELERAGEEKGSRHHSERALQMDEAAEELFGALEANDVTDPERHARMRARLDGLLAGWRIDRARPSFRASVAERLELFLAGWWPERRLAQAALAAACLVAGLIGGLAIQRQLAFDRLERRVDAVGESVATALLENASASERLRGVTLSAEKLGIGEERAEERAEEREIIDALLEVLGYDPSENVRLAAVEALGRIADRPRVRAGLAEALRQQRSPLLQVTLADALALSGGEETRQAIEELLRREDLDPAVRVRLEELLRELGAKESV